jgi:hypothetical protein
MIGAWNSTRLPVAPAKLNNRSVGVAVNSLYWISSPELPWLRLIVLVPSSSVRS